MRKGAVPFTRRAPPDRDASRPATSDRRVVQLSSTVHQVMPGDFVPALGLAWLTPLYDLLVGLGGWEKAFKARLIDQAAIQPTEAVLDLGCGTGTLALEVKQRIPLAEVVGLDADPNMLRRARVKGLRAGLQVRFDQAPSWRLPYPDATFDVVLSTLFFHHLDPLGRSRTLVEVARVLKPGGRLRVADWGPQRSLLMAVLSFPDRLLDGLRRTAGAFSGRLTTEMEDAGLVFALETGTMATGFGRLTFYAAWKPGSTRRHRQLVPDSATGPAARWLTVRPWASTT